MPYARFNSIIEEKVFYSGTSSGAWFTKQTKKLLNSGWMIFTLLKKRQCRGSGSLLSVLYTHNAHFNILQEKPFLEIQMIRNCNALWIWLWSSLYVLSCCNRWVVLVHLCNTQCLKRKEGIRTQLVLSWNHASCSQGAVCLLSSAALKVLSVSWAATSLNTFSQQKKCPSHLYWYKWTVTSM